MKCIVTGAAGFVGSSICDRLLKEGHVVTGIDSFLEYYPREIKENNISSALTNPSFNFIEGNLLTLNLPELVTDTDWIFHQAAQAGVRASWGSYFNTYVENNILATQKLLEAVKNKDNIKKVVYASSSSLYGDAEAFPTSENVIPKPVSPYGVTKLGAEHLMSLYASQWGVPAVSLRYFTVYGPRQRPDMAFHRFIKSALLKEELTLYGDGEQSRDFTYIDDIVTANLQAAESGNPGDIFNLGGGTQSTINGVLDIIGSFTGPLKIKKFERQIGDAKHTSADTSKARKHLGFNPKTSLQDGIKNEIEWINTNLNLLSHGAKRKE